MTSSSRFRRERLPEPLTYYKNQGLRLSGNGKWRSTRCPFHDDRVPSLSIHIPSGGFNCHGCEAKGGNVLDFHCKRYKLSFEEAAQDLGAWEKPVPTVTPVSAPSRHLRLTPAQEAARRFAGAALAEGYRPEALHEYHDERGAPLFWVIRAKDSKTGKKWIRPMHWAGTYFALGLPKYERGEKPLYGLHLLAHRREEIVIVSEGEKCADKLQKLGLLATTSGSANSADGADWTPLAGRKVIIWPDHDEQGQRYAVDVVQRLAKIGCRTEVIDTAQLALSKGEDSVDWLRAHPKATRDAILQLPRLGKPEAPSVVAEVQSPAATTLHTDLEIIARWCAERCVRNTRAWGGVPALYRDLCDWCEPDYGFAPREFVRLLELLGIKADGEFAEGLILMQDLDIIHGLSA